MTTQEMLLNQLKERFPGETQTALAKRAGISVQRFNNYLQGIRTMDSDAIIGCATALGLDPRPLVQGHNADTAKTARERAFWKRMATAASVAGLCLVQLAFFSPAQAAPAGSSALAMPIMSTSR